MYTPIYTRRRRQNIVTIIKHVSQRDAHRCTETNAHANAYVYTHIYVYLPAHTNDDNI